MSDNGTEYDDFTREELLDLIDDLDTIVENERIYIKMLKKTIQDMNEDYTVVIAEMEAEIIRLKMGIV